MQGALLLCLTLLTASSFVVAEESAPEPPPWDRFALRIGGFAVRLHTEARVDSEVLGPGTDFDLELDAGLNRSQTRGRLDGHVRIGRRHRVDFGMIAFRRDSSRVLDRQIQFGDEVFDVGASLTTDFDNDLFKLAYRYDVLRRPRWDLGLSAGVSTFLVDLELSADPAGGGTTVAEREDFVAPVPMLGLHADVRLGGRWYLRAGGEYFAATIDGQHGQLRDVRAAFDWYPFERFGFGAGFNRLRVDYEDGRAPEVDLSYAYSGAMVYVSYVR